MAAQHWNTRVIRYLTQAVERLGGVPPGGPGVIIHWNDHVLLLLRQLRDLMGLTYRDYLLTTDVRVPLSGELYFDISDGVSSADAPIPADTTSRLLTMSVTVDRANSQSYNIPLLVSPTPDVDVSGVAAATLTLAAGATSAHSTFAGVTWAEGSFVAPRWSRASGSGRSSHRYATLKLVWKELR